MKKQTIITAAGLVVIIAAAILIIGGLPGSEPPGLTVSNEYGSKISAQRGTYSWKPNLSTSVEADSAGPLYLYKLGELRGIEPSENDDYSLSLKFGNAPQSVTVVIYPESAVATEDYSSMIKRPVSGIVSGYMFTVPSDGIYIVNVLATWSKGESYYYFYTTP